MSSNEKKEAIPDGIGDRIVELVERIKRSPNYTAPTTPSPKAVPPLLRQEGSIGIQLGIEVPDESVGSIEWKGPDGSWRYAFFATGRGENLNVSSPRKSLTCPSVAGLPQHWRYYDTRNTGS